MDFLNQLKERILGFFSGEKGQNTPPGLRRFIPRDREPPDIDVPEPTQSPAPTPTPTPFPRDQATLEDIIAPGLQESGFGQAPISTVSGLLAETGSQLPQSVDPLLPTILSLMETRGLQDPAPAQAANPFNIFRPGTQDLVQFPNLRHSMMGPVGGGETLNLLGLLREGGPYQEFLESGDLADFFRIYTPESDPRNPSNEELVDRFNTLREFFE